MNGGVMKIYFVDLKG